MTTVLIIEDDPTLLRGLKDNFHNHGFKVITATDGEQGMDALQRQTPDLLILDIMLPKINGYEICRSARLQKMEMPILMLTAKGQEEDIVRGLELGADDYITKPFSIRELLARAKAFLRRRKPSPSTIYEFGVCQLDLAAHRFLKNGQSVPLTNKEFRLLEFFLLRPGRALTRDTILQAVWGSDILVTARSVDRCITTLRGKIEPDPSAPTYITTLRDIGYRLEIPVSAKVLEPNLLQPGNSS